MCMKKVFILLPLLAFGVANLRAQLALQPGATWLFDGSLWSSTAFGEKWEYMGDSVSVASGLKKMRVTIRSVNAPGNPPTGVAVETVSILYFSVSGDTVRFNDNVVANFSLQAGDQAASPLLTPQNLQMFSTCDSSIFYHPATVTASGTETVNGNGYRYYDLHYLEAITPGGDSIFFDRRYSEYNWITVGYWQEFISMAGPDCSMVVDYFALPRLVCYYDDQYADPSPCEMQWFDKMGMEEQTDISAHISLYPNPSTEKLNLSLPQNTQPWTYSVVSVDGKRVSAGRLTGAQLDVSALDNGMYFLVLGNGAQSARLPFVKQ